MSLASYLPIRDACLIHRGNEMPVIGVKSLSMEVERLTSTYEVWLGVNDAKSIVAASDNAVLNAISMVPTDMDESSTFVIDGISVQSTIKYYAYNSLKHAYLVRIEFPLDKDKVKPYILEKDNNSKKQTRFDILDL